MSVHPCPDCGVETGYAICLPCASKRYRQADPYRREETNPK